MQRVGWGEKTLLLLAGVIVAGVAWQEFTIRNLDTGEVIGIVFCSLLVFGLGCYYIVRDVVMSHRFKTRFGFKPPRDGEEGYYKLTVEKGLIDFATAFDTACRQEKEFRKGIDHSPEQIEKKMERLRHFQAMVRIAKKKFWQVWSVAKAYGFEVKKSYKDYLPPHLKETAKAV